MKKIIINKNEKNLLLFIRFAPLFLILLLSIIIVLSSSFELKKDLNKDIKKMEENYTFLNKKYVKERVEYIYEYIVLKEKNALLNLKTKLKDEVNRAHDIAISIYNNNKDIKTKEEIISLIKLVLRKYSFNNGRGYIFIDDIKGNKVLHPLNSDLEGKNLYNFMDAKGYQFVKTIVNTIKDKSERYDEYYWYKDKEKIKSYKKIGFYKYFEPYEFAIGSGEYLEDFKKDLTNEIIAYIKYVNSKNDDYIFISDYQNNILAHKDDYFLGKSISNIIGQNNLNKFMDIAKQGGDFVSYSFPVDDKGYFKKTSFVKAFSKWKWIVGSGYLDYKLTNEILEKRLELEKEEKNTLFKIIIIGTIATVLLMWLSLNITNSLQKRFIDYRVNLKKEEEEKRKVLAKSEKIYEDLFESNKSIILLIDPITGNIVNANKTACDFYGYLKKELISLNISDINILTKEECKIEIKKALNNKKGYFNFIHKLANGELKNVRVVSSLSNYFNKPILFSIINDVSGEYIAKNKLLETENEFKLLFEFSNIGLGIRDINGNFIKINRKLIDMLGYDEKFLLNKSCTHISSKEKLDEEISLFKQLIDKKIQNYNIEKNYIRKDGTSFEAILSMASCVNQKGDVSYILSSVIDISEMKRKDNILFQQSKMAAMGEMIGNIAHQWKQPLNLISLSNGLLKMNKEIEGFSSEEEIDTAINNITNGVEYLSTTIDDFRNFFKPNRQTTFFKIENCFEKTLKLTSAQFEARGISIIKNIELIEIESFENELIQVLMNILNNSRDAFEEQKGDKLIFIDVFKRDNRLIIKIKDSAGGIPEDIISKVFEPYFTTKHQSRGTGIGLFMSQEIIIKHLNGNIFVKNKTYIYKNSEYKGAEFTIELDGILD